MLSAGVVSLSVERNGRGSRVATMSLTTRAMRSSFTALTDTMTTSTFSSCFGERRIYAAPRAEIEAMLLGTLMFSEEQQAAILEGSGYGSIPMAHRNRPMRSPAQSDFPPAALL
jgi:hypothetical protein